MNLGSLQANSRGEILTPGTPGYDDARQIWNGMIDRRPAAIARCTGPADVAAAVHFAAENDIYPAIRAGGHNVAGLAMVDDGLIIDLTPMKGIVVDAKARTATAQTGLTWGGFDRETQVHGLATTGGLISTTGIAGLTLGGGVGWLMGRCGFVCDNTLVYDLVTADGAVIRADAEQNPDLFWALKGGGGNFGVVTSIQYRMYEISTVLSGMIVHPLQNGRDVLRYFRDFVSAGRPDELIVYAGAVTTPDGIPVVAILPSYCGDDLSEGERLIELLRKFGPPVADTVARMPYVQMQQMMDAAAGYGLRSYWKSTYLKDLTDEGIDTFLDFARRCPSPRTILLLEHYHGVPDRVAPTETAFHVRDHAFNAVLVSLWADAADDPKNIEWTRAFYSALQPWGAGAVYVNALSEDDAGRINEAYGPNYARLAAIKAKYDPENRFRRNQNIRPQQSAAAG